MYRIVFLTEAVSEMENARRWYAEQQSGLEISFTENIFAAIEKIQSDKIIYGVAYRGLSRLIVKRFPYTIYFKKDMVQKQIIVFGILHQKQSRANLDKRI